MTIPSSLLIQEIMHYEGFSAGPVLNRLGMPCIGYGFPLWEEGLSIVHGNTKIAKAVKNNLPNGYGGINESVRGILAEPLVITEELAKNLLEQRLLFNSQELAKLFSGYRHMQNKCAHAVLLPQSGLARYETHVTVRNQSQNAEKNKEKNHGTACGQANNEMRNSSKQIPHPAFLRTAYSSSAKFAKIPFFPLAKAERGCASVCLGGGKKPKQAKTYSHVFLTEEEQALLRLDSVLFASHLLGLEIMKRMHEFFFALRQDNYKEAANQLLLHGASGYLGAVVSVLARRIREGNLDLQDIFVQKEPVPKMLLHRKTSQNREGKYFQKRQKQMQESLYAR
ncbi:MAG: hypothetical protein K2I05_00330 [Mailhella sp.]|nr:hypothetical protein [Mailhella sp.]